MLVPHLSGFVDLHVRCLKDTCWTLSLPFALCSHREHQRTFAQFLCLSRAGGGNVEVMDFTHARSLITSLGFEYLQISLVLLFKAKRNKNKLVNSH